MYPYLSRAETKLAGMILEQPREFTACSMAELSRISGVSQGCINNFSKKFSSCGLPALKLRIAGSLSASQEKPFTVTDKSLGVKAAMELKIQESTAVFRNTLEINDEASLKQAVELILAAKKIGICGVFNSGIVANALCYQLIQLGIPAAFFSDTLPCSVSASMLDSSSLTFATSSSGRTREIIDAVELAQKNGTPVICLTADKFSPLAKMADCTLLADRFLPLHDLCPHDQSGGRKHRSPLHARMQSGIYLLFPFRFAYRRNDGRSACLDQHLCLQRHHPAADGRVCLLVFWAMEKAGIISYGKYDQSKGSRGSVRILIKHQIVRFTFISAITGVVRTTVVFWMPTYISQHLNFSPQTAAFLFTAATIAISAAPFASVFLYERLHRDMELTMRVCFILAVVSFLMVYLIRQLAVNILFLIAAILAANSTASMMWTRYCPGLRDTGMVSSATGYLDFISYMAASASSKLFANAVSSIGWGNLIFIWFGLMLPGILATLPIKHTPRRMPGAKI